MSIATIRTSSESPEKPESRWAAIKAKPVGRADSHQGAEQDTVRIDLHGGFDIFDIETPEMEDTHCRTGLSLLHELAVAHEKTPVAQCGQLRVMGHYDKSLPETVPESEEQTVQLLFRDTVQIA